MEFFFIFVLLILFDWNGINIQIYAKRTRNLNIIFKVVYFNFLNMLHKTFTTLPNNFDMFHLFLFKDRLGDL